MGYVSDVLVPVRQALRPWPPGELGRAPYIRYNWHHEESAAITFVLLSGVVPPDDEGARLACPSRQIVTRSRFATITNIRLSPEVTSGLILLMARADLADSVFCGK